MANERHTSNNSAGPLAIVGLSFKLPQDAVDEMSFWEVMEKKKNLSTDWPTDRTCLDGFYQDGPKEPNMVCYCPGIKAAHINATILTQ
jgi:acyl transferase domain-containing protein